MYDLLQWPHGSSFCVPNSQILPSCQQEFHINAGKLKTLKINTINKDTRMHYFKKEVLNIY